MTKRTVLVVDDDPATCEIVQMALEDEGYRVLCAADEPGLVAALLEGPDVILLDVFMPVIDSLDLSRRLRADAATSAIPIIAMSAAGEVVMGKLRADDHLAKPFDLNDLSTTVRRWVSNPLA